MAKRSIAALIALVLSACVASPMPERVNIPVAVPCRVERIERPVWSTEVLRADAGLFEMVRALLAEREERQAYEAKLEAAVKACQ